ncbi:MAG TPA: glycosyltransferase family 9 protein [Acidobacteriota bacterium]|nr:glycosyltransferase family 9 protein [Acidobacteriota bacterium]
MSGNLFERLLKRLGLRLLRSWAPARGPAPTTADLEKVERILVVKPDERIGNAILVTSLLVALKGRFSRAHQVCLLSRRYGALREHLPSTDEFILFDKHAAARSPLRFLAVIRRLRAMRFDLVFDAAGDHTVSFTHLALAALSGGRFRIGHARGAAGQFYEVAVPVPEGARHASETHLDLLRAITPVRSSTRPLLRPAPDSGFAVGFRSEHGIDESRPLVVIHPGARGPKQWPPESFAQVARHLKDRRDITIACVWGPADREAAEAMCAAAPDAVIPAGILSFDDLISLVRDAAVFLSADCGPMHLAAAAGTPVVAVFQASELAKYHTLGPFDRALDGRSQPLSTDTVVDAVLDVMDRSVSSSERITRPPTRETTGRTG